MRRIFLLIMSIMLCVSTFRVLNRKEYMSMQEIVQIFATYEFSFDNTHMMIVKAKTEFEEAKAYWDSLRNNQEDNEEDNEEEQTNLREIPVILSSFDNSSNLNVVIPPNILNRWSDKILNSATGLLRKIASYVIGVYNFLEVVFLLLGTGIYFLIDLVLNAYNLFNLAMSLLGFDMPILNE